MDIDKANINNLKSLWQLYGGKQLDSNYDIHCHTRWPYRAWTNQLSTGLDMTVLNQLPFGVKWPVMPIYTEMCSAASDLEDNSLLVQLLESQQWQNTLEQTAMYLSLAQYEPPAVTEPFTYETIRIQSTEQLVPWAHVIESAFGYSVDVAPFASLLGNPKVKILGVYENDVVVATALLFKTGSVVGLHQMGVKESHQGRGIAKGLMLELIKHCSDWQASHVVLQASTAGAPLYKSLGFIKQFLIQSFERSPVV